MTVEIANTFFNQSQEMCPVDTNVSNGFLSFFVDGRFQELQNDFYEEAEKAMQAIPVLVSTHLSVLSKLDTSTQVGIGAYYLLMAGSMATVLTRKETPTILKMRNLLFTTVGFMATSSYLSCYIK